MSTADKPEDSPTELRDRLQAASRSVLTFLKGQSTTILWMVVILLLILLFPSALAPIARKKVVLASGPARGQYHMMGEAVEDEFKKQSPWKFWGRSFELTNRETEGAEENRELVDRDRTGTHIGFTHDGFQPTPNVKSVLHLYDAPLHIVVNLDYFAMLAENWGWNDYSFSSLAESLRGQTEKRKAVTVYLGLKKSGTRQAATVVLKHYAVDPDLVDCKRDYDIKEAVYAVEEGKIKVAFLNAYVGSPLVTDLAQAGKCVLSNLEDDAVAIAKANPFFTTAEIPRHTYSAANYFPEVLTKTVATRQVLVCSADMSDADVYWIAKTVDTRLRNSFPEIPWAKDISPVTKESDFKYQLHPGAIAFKDDKEPGIVAGVKYVLFVVLVPAVITLFQRLPGVLWSLLRPPARAAVAPVENDYQRLNSQLGGLLAELEKVPPPVTNEIAKAFEDRAEALEKEIEENSRKKTIDDAQKESLSRGMRNIRFELRELRRSVVPAPVAAATTTPSEPPAPELKASEARRKHP